MVRINVRHVLRKPGYEGSEMVRINMRHVLRKPGV